MEVETKEKISIKGMFSNEKGITLIALIITVIVLLILAGISIRLLLGENGIIEHARWSAFASELEEISQNIELKKGSLEIKEIATGIKQDLFDENYRVDDSTEDSLILKIVEARKQVGADGYLNVDTTNLTNLRSLLLNDNNIYYIDKKTAGKDYKYIYDFISNTVFKIKSTKIYGVLYHNVRIGSLGSGNATNGITVEPIEPEIETVDYKKYIPIYTASDFQKIGSDENREINGTTYLMSSEAVYVLQNDIDFNGITLSPLPEFKGILYGSGYTIKNINIDNTANTENWTYYSNDVGTVEPTTTYPNGINKAGVTIIQPPTGIFSRVIGGTQLTEYDNYIGGKIHNLKILNTTAVKGKGNVGLLIGDGAGIEVRDITIESDNSTKGLIHSEATAYIVDEKEYKYANVSGIIGYLYNSDKISQFNNINIKDLELTANNSTGLKLNIAGIVAITYGKAQFESCTVQDISGEFINSGILQCAKQPVSFYNCWAKNLELNSYNNSASGGLAGYIDTDQMLTVAKGNKTEACIYNCGVENLIIKANVSGGLVGNTNGMSLTFEKVKAENIKTSSASVAGGIIGFCNIPNAETTIHIKTATLTNNGIASADHSGGIIGFAFGMNNYVDGKYQSTLKNTIIENVEVKDSTIFSGQEAGGIIGYYIGDNLKVLNSIIKNDSMIGKEVGGAVGEASTNKTFLELENCEVSDLIINASSSGGGVIALDFGLFNISSSTIQNIKFSALLNSDGTVADIPRLDNTTFAGQKYFNSDAYQLAGMVGESPVSQSYNDTTIPINVVKNVYVKNIDFENTTAYDAGGIVALTYSSVDFIDINVQGINMQNFNVASSHLGGIIGICQQNITLSGKISDIKIVMLSQGNSLSYVSGIGTMIYGSCTIGENTEISNINVTSSKHTAGLFGNLNELILNKGTNIHDITVESKSDLAAGIGRLISYIKADEITINNIKVVAQGKEAAGLIAYTNSSLGNNKYQEINNSVITNINVSNYAGTSSSSYAHCGGLIGTGANFTFNNTKISNIETITGNPQVGGLKEVGDLTLKNCEITNIKAISNNSSNPYASGGILGLGNLTVSNTAINEITVEGFGMIGGIVGFSTEDLEGVVASNVKVKNKIPASGYFYSPICTGGIVGFAGKDINNVSISNSIITNGICVGGIVGFSSGNSSNKKNVVGASVNNVIINTSDERTTYAAGGIVGHGTNVYEYNTTVKDCIVENLTISNANFAGGIAGLAVPNITNCTVSGDTSISSVSTENSQYYPFTNGPYVCGYSGGIIGAGGKLTSKFGALNFSDNRVTNASIHGQTMSSEIYGAGTYYLDSYTGEKGIDNIVNCTHENVTIE